MNANKIKIAFIVILGLVLITGIYLLSRGPSSSTGLSSGDDKGFLSFFGDRKNKPVDETTIPGVGTSNGGTGAAGPSDVGSGAGDTGGSDAGQGTGSGSQIGGQGSLSMKSIGTNNVSTNGGGTLTGGSTGGNGSTGGITGGGSNGGGTGNTGGNTGIIIPPIPQIDCTPPQLPYTAEEIAKLKSLTNDFYRISANLHTDVDIQNELDTRKSYYDLYNKTKEYTTQCYAQVAAEIKKAAGNPFCDINDTRFDASKCPAKAINSNARWHPYLTETVLNNIAKSDKRITFSTPLTDKGRLEGQIRDIQASINSNNAQIAFINKLPSPNYIQNLRKDQLAAEVVDFNEGLIAKQNELSKIAKPTVISGRDILGSFFFESTFDGINLKIARENLNYRRRFLWQGVENWLRDNDHEVYVYYYWRDGNNKENPGKFCQVSQGKPSCVNVGWDYNPLVELLWNPIGKETYLDTAGEFGKAWANPFQWIEDGLNIW